MQRYTQQLQPTIGNRATIALLQRLNEVNSDSTPALNESDDSPRHAPSTDQGGDRENGDALPEEAKDPADDFAPNSPSVDVSIDTDEDGEPEQHTLGVDEGGDIILHSDPQPLAAFLARKRLADPTLLKLSGKVKVLWKNTMSQTKGQQIADILKEIAQHLQNIAQKLIPPTKVTFTPKTIRANLGAGKFVDETVTASLTGIISLHPGQMAGSSPSPSSTPYMDELHNYAMYKRGHMLNHKVHGPGYVPENLVPISTMTNKAMEIGVEKKLKELVLSQRKVVRYTVTITGWGNYAGASGAAAETQLPTQFDFLIEQLGTNVGADRSNRASWTVVKNSFPFSITHAVPNDTTGKFAKDAAPAGNLPTGILDLDRSDHLRKQQNRTDGRADVWEVDGAVKRRMFATTSGMQKLSPLYYDHKLLQEPPVPAVVQLQGRELHVFEDKHRRTSYGLVGNSQKLSEQRQSKDLTSYELTANKLSTVLQDLHKDGSDTLRDLDADTLKPLMGSLEQESAMRALETFTAHLAKIDRYNERINANKAAAWSLREKIKQWVDEGKAAREIAEDPSNDYDTIEKVLEEWNATEADIKIDLQQIQSENNRIEYDFKNLQAGLLELKSGLLDDFAAAMRTRKKSETEQQKPLPTATPRPEPTDFNFDFDFDIDFSLLPKPSSQSFDNVGGSGMNLETSDRPSSSTSSGWDRSRSNRPSKIGGRRDSDRDEQRREPSRSVGRLDERSRLDERRRDRRDSLDHQDWRDRDRESERFGKHKDEKQKASSSLGEEKRSREDAFQVTDKRRRESSSQQTGRIRPKLWQTLHAINNNIPEDGKAVVVFLQNVSNELANTISLLCQSGKLDILNDIIRDCVRNSSPEDSVTYVQFIVDEWDKAGNDESVIELFLTTAQMDTKNITRSYRKGPFNKAL